MVAERAEDERPVLILLPPPDLSVCSETQNSPLRAQTRGPLGWATKQLHCAFPGLTADHLTFGGVGLVAAGTAVAEIQNVIGNKNKTLRVLAGGMVITGLICDAFDGAMARLIAAETGIKDPNGAVKDTLADRAEELLQNGIKACSASAQGNQWGRMMAIVNMGMSAAPSAVRASDEAVGFPVKETGDAISFWGTRSGRALLNIAATFAPEIKGVKTQPIIDTIGVAVNGLSTYQRLRVPLDGNTPRSLSASQRQESLAKALVLGMAFTGSVMAARKLHKFLP